MYHIVGPNVSRFSILALPVIPLVHVLNVDLLSGYPSQA